MTKTTIMGLETITTMFCTIYKYSFSLRTVTSSSLKSLSLLK